ncbi:MAG: hypothetical protein IPP29_17000 [Bacteroidetes bacterium]|nr:hypothetical protein [Bacteroidota bacterium]
MKQVLMMCAVLMLQASACTNISLSKSDYIRNYEVWITQLKIKYKNCKDDDWVKKESEFKSFSENMYSKYKDEFTEEERRQVDNLTGQYYAVVAKHKGNQLKEN